MPSVVLSVVDGVTEDDIDKQELIDSNEMRT